MFRKFHGKALCYLFLAMLIVAIGSIAHAGKITAFTADQVHSDATGKVISSGKMYVAPGKMRMDGMSGAEEGRKLSMIILTDEKRQATLNTEKKLYFEGPLTDETMMSGMMKDMKANSNEKVLGTEDVGGFTCTKREVTTSVEFMGMKTVSKQTVWVTDKLDMPIRTRMQDGSTTELKNIVKGTPAGKYFNIPEDYKKVSSMMAVMGMEMSNEDMDEDTQAAQDAAERVPFKLPEGMPKEMKDFKFPAGN
ncbi:MAG: DUF4412 domain-containing protein [Desulfobacterales bacterium]|nr:DUF4412 domain-containing protein [Desulfobacterales bacterium]